jgi:DNA-binding NarL/FixJ family response regulator
MSDVSRVLLIDDHDLIRQGLARAFEGEEDFEVCGQASSVAEGLRLFDSLAPDVLITDVRLPDGTGLELVKQLRGQGHDTGMVVLTMYAGDEQLFAALRSFAAADLAGAMRRRMTPSGPQLTQRESEVLSLLARGFSVSAIARSIFVSDSTAKTHISKIYEKLGASNRADAIMKAVRSGLLADDLQE